MNYSQSATPSYFLRPPPMPLQPASPHEVKTFMTEMMENSKATGKKYILIACILCAFVSFTVADEYTPLFKGVFFGQSNTYMTQLNNITNCSAYVSTIYAVGILSWCLLGWSGFVFLLNLFKPWCAGICVLIQGLLLLSCVNFLISSKVAVCDSQMGGSTLSYQLLVLTLTALFGLLAIFWYEKRKDQASRNKQNLDLIMSQ